MTSSASPESRTIFEGDTQDKAVVAVEQDRKGIVATSLQMGH